MAPKVRSRKRMGEQMAERIKKLREEIAQIRAANRMSAKMVHDTSRQSEQERRLQRLQEIIDELLALTDWKKQ